ncbi:hypothetical protein FG386_002975 [Cryptosporidium ryanae]|uniref:uncharacterized protein n=1 Tax=Cryptosporidium ryanae TaxID=515981 RepID=UPI00351A823D|nr:hypothetical protein FG386_002975 [Cryptosporidium ryanae]
MEGFLKSTNTFKTLDEMFCSSNSSSSGVNGDERFSSVGLLYTTADKNKKSDSCLGKSTKKKRNDEDKDIKNIVENNKRGKVTNKTSLLSFDFDQQTEIKGENKIVEQMMGKNDNETKEKSESFNIIENNIQVSEENYTSLSFNSIGKDKTIDTSFLPDRKKEIEEQIMIEKLKKEEIEKEEKLKSQIIEVVFSYWEGRGHRRSIKIQRDATIGEFLEKCRIKLKSEFKEFARISRYVISPSFRYSHLELFILFIVVL